jgi:hypothetical protein
LTRRLYVAAKAPRPGLAKTRLAATIGDVAALDLYCGFLSDLAARFATASFPLGWYVTPADAWTELVDLVGWTGQALVVLDQGPGDWTERQRRLLREAPARGEERIILIGSDSPQTTVDTIEHAFALLDEHDVVLGPVVDGGYYLIGMRGWHDVLDGVQMSTSSVFENILARAHAMGVSVGQVEELFDVDEADELDMLRGLLRTRDDMPATRAALESHGVMVPSRTVK